MSIQDLLNAVFEGLSGFMLWNNVRILIKDKKVRGVSILTIMFFSLWGYWNLYYYPFLNQTLSFLAGFIVVSANTTWVILAIRYTRKDRLNEKKNI